MAVRRGTDVDATACGKGLQHGFELVVLDREDTDVSLVHGNRSFLGMDFKRLSCRWRSDVVDNPDGAIIVQLRQCEQDLFETFNGTLRKRGLTDNMFDYRWNRRDVQVARACLKESDESSNLYLVI